MKNVTTPLYDALLKHRKRGKSSFHVPGHKNGTVFYREAWKDFWPLLQLDVTELNGLDDLHAPEGPIAEAEKLASQLYGSRHTFFLVGGSTVGNLAMLLATLQADETVLVQRNVHQSIINGLKLRGAHPVYLPPEIDRRSGLACGIHLNTLQEAICRFPAARAVVLTNPNYYGMGISLRPLIQMAHSAGLYVLVDEAHGAHFALGTPFPPSALQEGADFVVHSAHKTLPAMTMGAFLHLNTSRISVQNVRDCLALVETSSPSYPVMASLDLARAYMEEIHQSGTTDAIAVQMKRFREMLNEYGAVLEHDQRAAYDWMDPLKVVFQPPAGGGIAFGHLLEKFGVYVELADQRFVLFVLPLSTNQEHFRLPDALFRNVSIERHTAVSLSRDGAYAEQKEQQEITTPVLSFAELSRTKGKTVSLEEAEGNISLQDVTPYPPGVPLLLAGERITKAHLQAIESRRTAGAHFQKGAAIFTKGIRIAATIK